MNDMIQAIQPEPGDLVSFVGAGGKTSALLTLARELIQRGDSVLVTTTTAMFHPEKTRNHPAYRLFPDEAEVIMSRLSPESGSLLIAARSHDREQEKIRGFSAEDVDDFHRRLKFDVTLVEADGSKRRSIKAPASHEPVIPGRSTLVIGVIGMDCLGKPLNQEFVHRPELLAHLADCPLESPITEATMVSLVCSPVGLFKAAPAEARKILLLNKADSAISQHHARSLAEAVSRNNRKPDRLKSTLICSFNHPVSVLTLIDP